MNTSKRAFFAMLGLVVLLIAAAGGITYLGLGELQKKGDELAKLKVEQKVLETKQSDLIGAKRDIADYTELEKISKAIVPQEKDQARTAREIVALGQQAGVPLESVQFPSSELGAVARKKSTSKSKKSQPKVDPNKTQLIEVPGTTGLYAMSITIKSASQSPVRYNQLLDFLERLEQNRRTAHVTNISIEPFEQNRNLVTFTVMLNVYMKPVKQ